MQDLWKQNQGLGSWKGDSRVLWKANDLCQRLARGGLNFKNPFGKLFFTARRLRAPFLTNTLRFEAFVVENYDYYAGHYCTGHLTTDAR